MYSPPVRCAVSDEESYMTVSSAPPKRRAGRTKFRETRHPVFKGVRCRNTDRWVCEVREPRKKSRIWLGTFPTAEMAARAHDVAALALRGRAACLNFADSAWRLPTPQSSSPRDIQRAAAEAAEAFRPGAQSEVHLKSAAPPAPGDEGEDPYYLEQGLQKYIDMAEGLLIDPPAMASDINGGSGSDGGGEMSLWSY
ncbi:Dehydration-responsive element-binding protein 1E [Platanthera zijinensis]|uniref:Dehydration-responsive element-binding protein 1E n=1 Tax=Platanthera zijinensis TaxID=2320716 RepID=A0AAP0BNA9_9ASPA